MNTTPVTPLGDLLRYIEQQSAGKSLDSTNDTVGPENHGELKAIRYFRDTWSQLSVEQQLAGALEKTPENAGPLNSHFLVLRSLQLMHNLSPDYLQRFLSYTDALLCLTQLEHTKPVSKKAPRKRAVKK